MGKPVSFDISTTEYHLGVLSSFVEIKDRGDTRIRSSDQGRPLIPGFAQE